MAQRTLIFLAGLLWAAGASAQTTRVRGQVTDAADGKPLQFVSVVFPGTTTGITTDEQGIYALETRDTVSRVQASMVGYATRTLPLTPGTFNHVDFALEAVEFGIGQVVITPGENPAYPILDGVIRNKPLNDPERYDTYSCRTYTKMELDLTNIRPQFRSRRLQRNFGFVFDYVDTSALTGQAYLPAMISESTADLYRSGHPAFKREVIRASRISGVEDNFAAAQFTGGMHGDVNFYDNFIDIFNVRFASPLSDGGRAFYNYFLVDSMVTEGRKIYKIRFHPKRLTTPVLDGEVNIDSASYALQSASARMPKGVNVNWIRHLMLDNENRPADKGRWFRVRDRVSAEFSVSTADSSKLTSFIGTREVAYSDVRIGEPIPDEVLAHGQQRRGARRGTQAPPGGVLGAGAPLQFERKGERHLRNGRLGAARATVPQHLHPHQHSDRRLLEYKIHRHRSLLQTGQLQQAGRLPHAAGRAHDDRSEPHGARQGATWPTARATRT